MARVVLENVTKTFGPVRAVDGVSLTVEEGELLTLLGPSGCGKTTTLRMVAGFLLPTKGRIFIGGEDVSTLPPRKRNIGMVFQDYALFPHLTVAENVGFGLRERRVDGAAIRRRVDELLDLIRLPGVENRYPKELSGGQQQRVALARALAYSPRVLLVDEPFGALDLKLRETMQVELHRIQRQLGITTVFVTHDQGEAMSLSDRIVVMLDGRIEQVGAPEELYARPATAFVAHFIGKSNFLGGTVAAVSGSRCAVTLDTGARVEAIARGALAVGARAKVAVRPERLRIGPSDGDGPGNKLAGVIERRLFLGNLTHTYVRAADGLTLLVESPGGVDHAAVGAAVAVRWDAEHGLAFADDGGRGGTSQA